MLRTVHSYLFITNHFFNENKSNRNSVRQQPKIKHNLYLLTENGIDSIERDELPEICFFTNYYYSVSIH